ncbi:MAG TPA: hypothetical protein VLK32_02740 [Bacillota bacterium]|nr:hypothetical protein [Bacillota bacterium]
MDGRAARAAWKPSNPLREEPGLLAETGSIRFNAEAQIPGVGVSREVGATLQRLAKKGPMRLRLWNLAKDWPAPHKTRRQV